MMITIFRLSLQFQAYFTLFFSLVLAALQNVTVDDSAVTGPSVPTYAPSPSAWNQGNNCSGCLAKPDPSLAYNNTWHDATFSPNSTVVQSFQFTFVGSGLYIFFILANTVPYANTLTNVSFYLDGIETAIYTHNPTTSTNYEYNQSVYANGAIPYGQHSMEVMPINQNNVLILFDYYVYTEDPSLAVTTTTSEIGGVTNTAIPTSTGTATTSSGPNIGDIIGGTIAGIGTLVVVLASLLYYRRYKRRAHAQSLLMELTPMDPFVDPPIGQASSKEIRSPPTQVGSRTGSPGPSSSANAEILEQVGLLRDEVAHLRHLQERGWESRDVAESQSEPPPEYS